MENLIVTNAGQALIAKLIAGTAEANFTKIKTSDYDYVASDIPTLSDLSQVKHTSNVSSISIVSSSIVRVRAVVNNTGLNTGYYVKAVGLYAEDSSTNEEILFGVSLCGDIADYMPAQSDVSTGITYTFNCKVDNTEQVTVIVDPSGVASAEDLLELDTSVTTHISNNVGTSTGVHGLRYYSNKLQYYNNSTWNDVKEPTADTHIDNKVNTSTGVHGLRYYSNKLQCYNNNTWGDVKPTIKLYRHLLTFVDTTDSNHPKSHVISIIATKQYTALEIYNLYNPSTSGSNGREPYMPSTIVNMTELACYLHSANIYYYTAPCNVYFDVRNAFIRVYIGDYYTQWTGTEHNSFSVSEIEF